MLLTIGMITLVGTLLLGLPLGAAVLLGAVLAPTDPVLASDVQVTGPRDRDRLRFTLTGEAGLNDGTAFPFVILGLGLFGLEELGAFGLQWLAELVVVQPDHFVLFRQFLIASEEFSVGRFAEAAPSQ